MGTIVLDEVEELTTIKISELPSLASANNDSVLPIVDSENTYKITRDDLLVPLLVSEITTPAPVSGYGQLYAKTDNRLYYQNSTGSEHMISNSIYGEGWFYGNTNPIVIETVDIPIAVYGPIAGEFSDMTFSAGGTGLISAFSDGGGGTVIVTSNNHGLSNGAPITIMGSTNYNGVFEVSSITTNTFKITDTWVTDDGIATWVEGASIVVNTGGVYHLDAHISATVDRSCIITWMPYKGTTPILKATTELKFPNNDINAAAMSVIEELSVGDKLWMSVQSDTLVDVIGKHGGMRAHML